YCRGLRTIRIKGITQTCLETREARGLVLNHVVVARGVYCAKGGTKVGLHEAGTKGATNAWNVLRAHGGLTTKGQLTPAVPRQTKVRLTTKQTSALLRVTGIDIKTALELENGTQTITQVLGTS